ncbi:probable purine permease 10 [Cajanus cajan]|uniref:Probable purine permease n=1 Tax=Cajanus cajan TaxID=3821 RepID=A0A151R3E5_CAJCA|nr:probable purine permease 10 [Cajanus cajan]KYP37012.1 putative purine permease 10 [Cajanus cajan]
MSTNTTITHQQPQHSRSLGEYKRWLRVSLYTILLLAGQCSATLLGRSYFEKGGKSRWIALFVQSAGFPILLPLLFYSQTHAKSTKHPNNDSSKTKPKISIIFSLYLAFGLAMVAMDLMYAYGLQYLPLSTFTLVCASQLGFNAIFTFFLNSQKLTALIINSIVVLTMSVTLLAINTESKDTKHLPKEKQIIGFFCVLAASAMFSLYQSLLQVYFEKVMKTETLSAVLNMNFYPMLVATCGGIVGLFVSGDWKTMETEMKEFEKGGVSYVMTLVWISVTWQIACVGMLGLTFEVSSLFSTVIGNLELAINPILAVMVFHDKIYGVKVIAFLLAIWGLLSYMYQHYLDEQKAKENKSNGFEVSKGEGEI